MQIIQWFGAYFYKEDHLELFDKDQALLEFSKQIPYVLEHMRLPIKGDRELSDEFSKNIVYIAADLY